jgi:hypothetical protein
MKIDKKYKKSNDETYIRKLVLLILENFKKYFKDYYKKEIPDQLDKARKEINEIIYRIRKALKHSQFKVNQSVDNKEQIKLLNINKQEDPGEDPGNVLDTKEDEAKDYNKIIVEAPDNEENPFEQFTQIKKKRRKFKKR